MSNHKDYILIVGGEVVLRERVLAGALRAAKGVPIYTVTANILSPNLRYFDGYIKAAIADHEGVLQAVNEHEKEFGSKPIAVIPTNDFTVVTASYVAKHYGLAHNPLTVINVCRDKYLMKKRLSDHNLPVPKFFGISNDDQLEEASQYIGFPAVIKPRLMAGSLGVIKVTSYEELKHYYIESKNAVQSIHGEANADETLFQLEEFIEYDHEVSVEVLNSPSFNTVLGVTDKNIDKPPYFVEIGHVVPSRFTGYQNLLEIAEKSCRALGIKYGMAHFEARINKNGDVKIIEVAARTGGDGIMGLVENVYGYNPYELHVASYLGNDSKPDTDIFRPRGIAAISFLKAPVGILEDINLPDHWPAHVVHVNISALKGQKILSLSSWKNREGFIEFFWRGREQIETLFHEHLDTAYSLSKDIFLVK